MSGMKARGAKRAKAKPRFEVGAEVKLINRLSVSNLEYRVQGVRPCGYRGGFEYKLGPDYWVPGISLRPLTAKELRGHAK